MRNIVAWIVFIAVQILFIPLAIVGVALSMYTQFAVSKRLGVSGTAAEIAGERLIMQRFGLREDRAIGPLLRALPTGSVTGGWLILFPWYLRYRISGKNVAFPVLSAPGKETVANLIPDRTVAIDRLIQKSSGRVEQFVSLGAGYDTRCYGSLKSRRLQFFELDQAETQRLKRASLQKAGIDASHVHFVEADFSSDNWGEAASTDGPGSSFGRSGLNHLATTMTRKT